MKLVKAIATIAAITCFSATAAFAAPEVTSQLNSNPQQQVTDSAKKEKKDFKGKEYKQKCDPAKRQEFMKDPVKALENRKENVQARLKEGKITKEKADAINARIDARIKEIKEFNSLSVQQKKTKLVNDFKVRLEQKVKEGKIPQEKMDELLKGYSAKIEKWDGTGYPQFEGKGFKHKRQHSTDKK